MIQTRWYLFDMFTMFVRLQPENVYWFVTASIERCRRLPISLSRHAWIAVLAGYVEDQWATFDAQTTSRSKEVTVDHYRQRTNLVMIRICLLGVVEFWKATLWLFTSSSAWIVFSEQCFSGAFALRCCTSSSARGGEALPERDFGFSGYNNSR